MENGKNHLERPAKRKKGNNTSAPTGRRKKACQTCRLRKVKCDFSRPICALCKTTSTECQYLEESEEPFTLEKAVEVLSGQLRDLSRRIDGFKDVVDTTSHGGSHVSPHTVYSPTVQHRGTLSPTYSTKLPAFEHSEPEAEPESEPEPSRVFSHIPPQRTTADAVLSWPIFEHLYKSNHLIEPHLRDDGADRDTDDQSFQLQTDLPPLEEHQIPFLVDRFLENVHTKNPILDVEALVRRSRESASRGFGWDSQSCLILMACALGRVAKPFGSEMEALDPAMPLSAAQHLAAPDYELRQANNYFAMACRRLGVLKPSVLSCQCNFFAGVYLMYTLQPMLSWQYFHTASVHYQIFLKMKGRVTDDGTILTSSADHRTSLERQLTQRLYWSCFKSEAEFRVELPLPQSDIANYHFPNLFPSPPSPAAKDLPGSTAHQHSLLLSPQSISATSMNGVSPQPPTSEPHLNDIRAHAKSLSYQEESWFYYLTEIALRRIGNRIINTFFASPIDSNQWLDVTRYLNTAVEFEMQITSWWANLPPAMQKYETNSTIRAPRTVMSPGGAEATFVSQELSWATENRLLEMRHWLYQPFLYWLVHVQPHRPPHLTSRLSEVAVTQTRPSTLTQDPSPTGQDATLWELITRAIDCNIAILRTRSIPHRHHGLWYDLRALMSSSLILLAVVKAGYADLIPGGIGTLIGAENTGYPDQQTSNAHGLLPRCLRQMSIWAHESPDMLRCREVLLSLIHQVIPHVRLDGL